MEQNYDGQDAALVMSGERIKELEAAYAGMDTMVYTRDQKIAELEHALDEATAEIARLGGAK